MAANREVVVTEVAPGMWRVDSELGTFMAFWWTDSDVPNCTESFVWEWDGTSWKDYGGFGGTVGEYPAMAVHHVLDLVEARK